MNDQNERSHFDLWNIRDAIINGSHFDWQAGDAGDRADSFSHCRRKPGSSFLGI